MATPTAKLSLIKTTTADPFVTADIANNWQKIDDAPGTLICSSTTRPSGWGVNQTGRQILETDTGLTWFWSGSAWKRISPSGLLKTTGGDGAIGVRTSDAVTNSNTNYSVVQAISGVVVPDGNRPLRVTCSWRSASSDAGVLVAAIFRKATGGSEANSGEALSVWDIPGRPGVQTGAGGGGSYVYYERSGLSPGIYAWSFQFRSAAAFGGGQSTISGNSVGPISIAIEEV